MLKYFLDRLVIKANTSAYNYELEERKITLLEFIEKALHDYNLNSRFKVSLSEDVKPLLDVVAKESEWGDFTLRELLERAFKFVGIKPTFNYNREISYSKTQRVSRYIDLEQANDKEGEHISTDYYDKVISTSKNLVSQQDFVREIIPLTSIETEFSQLTTDNGGFITSNDIYYVSRGIIHTPNLIIAFTKGEDVTDVKLTNMGIDYYWDITQRLFEEDIYNSFPNVRLDANVSSIELSPRSYNSLLSKGNTINYKSGSNFIGGIFHLAEWVPSI